MSALNRTKKAIAAKAAAAPPASAVQAQLTQDQQLAQAALAFLQRAQLNGSEAETLLIVRNWLVGFANGSTVTAPALPKPANAG